MPLQNRVSPFGELFADPARGLFMGNRGGRIHTAERTLSRRRWTGRAWICCVLDFRGRRDPVMAPGHYTRLFFLDEPTALAAGHRPCAYCRRAEYNTFREAWASVNWRAGLGSKPRAVEIDQVLNDERVEPDGSKRLHPAELDHVPDGVFVTPILGAKVDSPIARSGDERWVRPARRSRYQPCAPRFQRRRRRPRRPRARLRAGACARVR